MEKKKIQKIFIENYKNLLQYLLKKGKKSLLENKFKQGIVF
jgi:hypothetical protein